VRVVEAGPSRELCGGTHCHCTGDIGLLLITKESSIGAGLRRIEALTGEGALREVRALRERAERISHRLRVPEERIADAVEQLAEQRDRLDRELETARKAGMDTSATGLAASAETLSGIRLVVANVGDADAGQLRALSDRVREQLGSSVVVLGALRDSKPSFAVAVTKDLNPGVDAAKIAKQISSIVNGSGGGQPHSATGGGKDASRLGEALEAARQIVREHFDGGRGAG